MYEHAAVQLFVSERGNARGFTEGGSDGQQSGGKRRGEQPARPARRDAGRAPQSRHRRCPSSRRPPRTVALPDGREEETPFGPCYVVERAYPLDYLHGPHPLAALTASSGRCWPISVATVACATCRSNGSSSSTPRRPDCRAAPAPTSS